MDIMTPGYLEMLCDKNKKQFEGLLPLLIKKLIISSCKTVSSIRIPDRDDIWAPGFDGIIICDEISTYVPSGTSVWEFGTNTDSLTKINKDYEKRTNNPRGVNKADTCFRLVIPKVWAYNRTKTISEWEKEHSEWKETRVYDATMLCDWINREPAICAWLLEQFEEGLMIFSTVSHAWDCFSHKTEPAFTPYMFLGDRDSDIVSLNDSIKSKVIRVTADTFVEAQGFVLASLEANQEYKELSIVINDEKTYRAISRIVHEKLLVLNYPCHHDLEKDTNRVIICYNKEDTSIRANIQLKTLRKFHFLRALDEMNVPNVTAGELYDFSHGNLRALIRRLQGNSNDTKPDWTKSSDLELLIPLLFLRKVNKVADKPLMEALANQPFEVIEKKYQELARMEDSPIKCVDQFYILVNYEETWDALSYTTTDGCFIVLTNTILTILESIVTQGSWNNWQADQYGYPTQLKYLLLNYIYFAFSSSETEIAPIYDAVAEILKYASLPNTSNMIIRNLSTLAEAAPTTVLDFLELDINNDESVIDACFQEGDRYIGILFGLDELMRHKETAVRACMILFSLYQRQYIYRSANSPEESLLTALCLWNAEVALTIEQKVQIAKRFMESNPKYGSKLINGIIGKDGFFVSQRIGRREESEKEVLTYASVFEAIKEMGVLVFNYSNQQDDAVALHELIQQYSRFSIDFLQNAAINLHIGNKDEEQIFLLNYFLRDQICLIQQHNWENKKGYLNVLKLWVERTSIPQQEYCWQFYKYYKYPFEGFLKEGDTFLDKKQEQEENRKASIEKIIKDEGTNGVLNAICYMEDIYNWGRFLSDALPADGLLAVAKKMSNDGKLQICCGLIDGTERNKADDIYKLISPEHKPDILYHITRTDVGEWLLSEDDEKIYWAGKMMWEYNDDIYNSFLRYNPWGLLLFYEKATKKDPSVHIDTVYEILHAIILYKPIKDKKPEMDTYLLHEMIKHVDKCLPYTDEWGKICAELNERGYIDENSDAASRYWFYHPEVLVNRFETDKAAYYRLLSNFTLPNCAYHQPEQVERFVDALISAGYDSFAGQVLGRLPIGTDGQFPHEIVRQLLEIKDSSKLDNGVFIGYVNNIGVRTVTDGSDLKKIGMSFYDKATRYEIMFPHTKTVLQRIGDFYMADEKHELLLSELMD